MIRADDHGTDLRASIEQARLDGGGEIGLGPSTYTLPGGYCAPLVHNLSIRGEGSASRVKLVGDGDVLIGCAASTGEARNLHLEAFDVVADGPRAGWALRLQRNVRSVIRDVTVDPVEVGWRNQFGIWVNGFDDVTLDNVTANARSKSLLVNGLPDQSYGADLYVTGGSKFTTERVVESSPGEACIHIAGAAGGVSLEAADVIYSDVNVLIDTAVAGVPNREIFLGTGLFLDSAGSDALRVGPKACSTLHIVGTWIASAGLTSGGYPNGNGVNVHYDNAQLVGVIAAARIFNHKGTGVALGGGRWRVGGGSAIYSNGGYGIDKANAAAVVELGDAMLYGNVKGDKHNV